MSRAQRDAYSAARRLQAELARIASRRERQIQKANADFQLELIQAVAGAAASSLKLVVAVLREDPAHLHLTRSLETVIESGPQVANDADEHERQTDAPPPLRLESPAPAIDGNESWGMPGGGRLPPLAESAYPPGAVPLPPPIDAEFEEVVELESLEPAPKGYRYPEPGEPAIELPDGTIVADESGAQA